MAGIDDLVHLTRPAAGEPEGAFVLLHGRGTSELDVAPLIDELDPDRRLLGVAPRGPLQLPPAGFHWYIVRQVGYPDPETFLPSFERLAGWFDALPAATGVPLERTVLGGFSQGAVMAYALSLGAGRPRPAGLIALSGFIPVVESLPLAVEDLDGFPVAIGHGTEDPIITIDFGRAARERLEEAGADVLYRESPIPHVVDPGYLRELRGWVSARVPNRS